jgi:hypothetical protein
MHGSNSGWMVHDKIQVLSESPVSSLSECWCFELFVELTLVCSQSRETFDMDSLRTAVGDGVNRSGACRLRAAACDTSLASVTGRSHAKQSPLGVFSRTMWGGGARIFSAGLPK